jgi:hypothetical protein
VLGLREVTEALTAEFVHRRLVGFSIEKREVLKYKLVPAVEGLTHHL